MLKKKAFSLYGEEQDRKMEKKNGKRILIGYLNT